MYLRFKGHCVGRFILILIEVERLRNEIEAVDNLLHFGLIRLVVVRLMVQGLRLQLLAQCEIEPGLYDVAVVLSDNAADSLESGLLELLLSVCARSVARSVAVGVRELVEEAQRFLPQASELVNHEGDHDSVAIRASATVVLRL